MVCNGALVRVSKGAHEGEHAVVCKIDGVIEELVLAVAAKHYNGNAAGALQQALGRTDPLFARLMTGVASGGDDDGL